MHEQSVQLHVICMSGNQFTGPGNSLHSGFPGIDDRDSGGFEWGGVAGRYGEFVD